MEYFLERIARSLREEFGNTLNRHCLIFPGRRAGLYFLKYLSRGLTSPVWAPSTLTINELFSSLSPLQVAGNELLLYELYKTYSLFTKEPGTFDDFYFWGDMLINDFDDADKYLADTSRLFGNVKDLKEIDLKFEGFTEEQKEIIKRFWFNFDLSKTTDQKSGFISLWSLMNDLYKSYRENLRGQNLAYEGMIFRDVAEKSPTELVNAVNRDMVHFIGFNALNACEKKLMTVMKDAGKARFYWDYDNSYIGKNNHNSAGLFMNENLALFGNDMPGDWSYDTLLSNSNVKRVVIETSSDIGQVKLIPGLLSEIPDLAKDNAHHTAVVLSDEALLVPLLSSLPDDTADINITMGYPLKQSSLYTLIRRLMDMQRTAVAQDNFYLRDVIYIIRHPLVAGMLDSPGELLAEQLLAQKKPWFSHDDFTASELLSSVFSRHTDPLSLSLWFREILSLIALKTGPVNDHAEMNIRNEMIYRMVLSLNRLEAIIKKPDISLSAETYLRLLDRLLKAQSIPFSGEPLSGVQVMGILETRGLDFKNLIILSVNEGVMPAISSSSSFIPLSLRQAFGLPSLNHQESIYAYHFYRLLERAENVTFMYNSNSEGLRSGEMSRFLIQMNYSDTLKPEHRSTGFSVTTPSLPEESVPRTAEHVRLLEARFINGSGKILSPSAINTWLNCRMKFCYKYINGIREPENVPEEIDPAMFGNILHHCMVQLYGEYSGKVMIPENLDLLCKNDALLNSVIDASISKEFRNGEDGPVSGSELIVHDVLNTYIRRILQADISLTPLTILNLEEFLDFDIEVKSGNNLIRVRTGGYADRIDRINGNARIVDYKTGPVSETICSVDDLFKEGRSKETDGWLQVLLYCEAYIRKHMGEKVIPSIYRIRKMTGKTFNDSLVIKDGKTEFPIDDYNLIRDQFMKGLANVVERIFDPDEPFTMTIETSKCRYCPYSVLCSR